MQVVADYEAGLEYADAVCIKDARRLGDAKEYLVEWSDGAPDTWESEDNITRSLVFEFEKRANKDSNGQQDESSEAAAEKAEQPAQAVA